MGKSFAVEKKILRRLRTQISNAVIRNVDTLTRYDVWLRLPGQMPIGASRHRERDWQTGSKTLNREYRPPAQKTYSECRPRP
jgi:hypothetical protein